MVSFLLMDPSKRKRAVLGIAVAAALAAAAFFALRQRVRRRKASSGSPVTSR
jgi:hypothetical protein